MKLVRWQPQRALRGYRPFDGFDEMGHELERVFGCAFPATHGQTLRDESFAPATDIVEDENQFHLRIDLPGMKRDEIDITVDGNTLTVQGEKKRDSEVKEDDYYRLERSYGKFTRGFTLPSTVDGTQIEATYKDGVLGISIPKSPESRSRKIEVNG